jgi:hypothetical protein
VGVLLYLLLLGVQIKIHFSLTFISFMIPLMELRVVGRKMGTGIGRGKGVGQGNGRLYMAMGHGTKIGTGIGITHFPKPSVTNTQ